MLKAVIISVFIIVQFLAIVILQAKKGYWKRRYFQAMIGRKKFKQQAEAELNKQRAKMVKAQMKKDKITT